MPKFTGITNCQTQVLMTCTTRTSTALALYITSCVLASTNKITWCKNFPLVTWLTPSLFFNCSCQCGNHGNGRLKPVCDIGLILQSQAGFRCDGKCFGLLSFFFFLSRAECHPRGDQHAEQAHIWVWPLGKVEHTTVVFVDCDIFQLNFLPLPHPTWHQATSFVLYHELHSGSSWLLFVLYINHAFTNKQESPSVFFMQ